MSCETENLTPLAFLCEEAKKLIRPFDMEKFVKVKK